MILYMILSSGQTVLPTARILLGNSTPIKAEYMPKNRHLLTGVMNLMHSILSHRIL